MKQKILLAIGLVVVIAACSFTAFWLGRAGKAPEATLVAPPAPATATATPDAPIDVEPSLKTGSRVEALSAEGWQPATIKEISGDQALIAYDRSFLGEERVDVRLLRKPEGELVAQAAPVATRPQAPAITQPATPPAPPLGPRTAAKLPLGTYACKLDTSGLRIDPDKPGSSVDEEVLAALNIELEMISEQTYRGFNYEQLERYHYDPASGQITWESGPLASEQKPAQYDAASKTIVTSMGGQGLTCTLRR